MFLLLAEVIDRSPIGTNENICGVLVVMPELVAAFPSPVGGTGFKNLINLRVGSVFGKLDGNVEVAASVPAELMNQIIMNLSAMLAPDQPSLAPPHAWQLFPSPNSRDHPSL